MFRNTSYNNCTSSSTSTLLPPLLLPALTIALSTTYIMDQVALIIYKLTSNCLCVLLWPHSWIAVVVIAVVFRHKYTPHSAKSCIDKAGKIQSANTHFKSVVRTVVSNNVSAILVYASSRQQQQHVIRYGCSRQGPIKISVLRWWAKDIKYLNPFFRL